MNDSTSSSKETKHVVRSESDGGLPGLEFDDPQKAATRASELNDEHGLPDDHEVIEEVNDV